MEMHQVRYFLAAARTLNFTRAAEECNVAQPSLTRAIRQLEEELGGDLFRRERPHAQLTELGQRMVPPLQQCYDSALSARSLATSIKSGEVASLRVALSQTIDLAMLLPHIVELKKRFKRMELKLLRGDAAETAQHLKEGRAELAVASSLGEAWERFDLWPLYTESFQLIVSNRHPLSAREVVSFDDLRNEPLLSRTYGEHAALLADFCRNQRLNVEHTHESNSQVDIATLLEQGFGFTLAPDSEPITGNVVRRPVEGLDLQRTVFLYSVAGRQRTPIAASIMKSLRAADWSRWSNQVFPRNAASNSSTVIRLR